MILVLYIPVLHQSYISFFEKYRDRVKTLYILDEDVLADFPLSQREIRAVSPKIIRSLLEKADYFPQVRLASKATLKQLATQNETIIMSDEYIADSLRDQYFKTSKVIQESFFLRYDEKVVQRARKEIEYSGQVTEGEFHQKILADLLDIKEKSSDWFLRVGAAIVTNDPLVKTAHNIRMPSPHSLWTVGDPRNYIEYGGDTSYRTTLHAERAVIAHCAREGVKIDGASIYVTTFPCPDCMNNIAESGIKRIYFKDGYTELSSEDVVMAYKLEIIRVL